MTISMILVMLTLREVRWNNAVLALTMPVPRELISLEVKVELSIRITCQSGDQHTGLERLGVAHGCPFCNILL